MFDFGLEHPAEFTALAGFVLVLVFYGLGWWFTGRDPAPSSDCDEAGTPGENLSPAALRYLHRMTSDTAAAAAALMSLAARGHLTIELGEGRIRLRKTDGQKGELPAGEASLAHDLLYTRSTLVLHNSVSKVVAPALSGFRRRLAMEHGREVFRANRGWLVAGLLLSALILGAAAVQSGAPLAFLVLSGLAITAIVALTALLQALLPHRYIFPEPVTRGLRACVRWAVKAGLIVVISPLAFVAVARLIADPPVPLPAIAFVAALAGLHVLIYHLIKAPTVPGAGTRRRIENFRQALAADKADAKGLPVPGGIYAFALDVEGALCKWTTPPPWLRIAEGGAEIPDGFHALGIMLTRTLDAAAMPPADALFESAPDKVSAAGQEAAE